MDSSSYSKEKNVLFISELPTNTNQNDLYSFFEDYKDDIQYISIDSNTKIYDIFNTRKQKATIVFKTQEKASEARNNLNMRTLKGKPLNIMWHETDNSIRYNNKANLFIKGIPQKILPREFYELFAEYGEIISCKICENETGDKLGYGYINYYNLDSAENAIKNLNKKKIMDSVLEVMHFKKKNERLQTVQENSSIYIKNIPKNYLKIDDLKKLFTKFGTITFAQMFQDYNHHFAIISFTSAESANKAKDEMNNKKLNEKEKEKDELPLYVDLLQKKSERKRMLLTKRADNTSRLHQENKNCNLYIKNLPRELTEKQLKELFSKIGPIKSVRISKILIESRDGDTDIDIIESRGFGYVCYYNQKDAQKAKEIFDEKKLPGFEDSPRPVLISYFMQKNERKQFLSKMQSQFLMPLNDKYPVMMPMSPFMDSSYKNYYNFNYFAPQYPRTVTLIGEVKHGKIINPKNNENNNNNVINNNNKSDEPSYDYLKSLGNEEQQKDYLGEFLFKKIEQHPIAQKKNFDIEIISRITGMILGIGDIKEIYQITTNDESLTSRINEALELLKIK